MTDIAGLIERLEKEVGGLILKSRRFHAQGHGVDALEAACTADGMMKVIEPLKALLKSLETEQ